MKRESPLNSGDLFEDQFEIRRLLGSGGHAFVYHAYDQIMGREVALKLIEIPETSQRDRQRRARLEAQVLGRLSHPNIVRVHGGGVAGEHWIYLVMELLTGRSLRQALLEHGTISLAEALTIGAQIADGVHAAHAEGIIHRDLKPDNVFLERENHVRVIDFGVAKLQGPESPTTQRDLVHGTGLYMSPEHLQGTGVTAASDVFALGVTLYEAIFGCCPALIGIDRFDLGLMTQNQISWMPPALHELMPNVPPFVSRVVQRMLAKNPAERIENMAEVASILRAALDRLRTEGGHDVLGVRDLCAPLEPTAGRPPRTHAPRLSQAWTRQDARSHGTAHPERMPLAAFPTARTAQAPVLAIAPNPCDAMAAPVSRLTGTSPIAAVHAEIDTQPQMEARADAEREPVAVPQSRATLRFDGSLLPSVIVAPELKAQPLSDEVDLEPSSASLNLVCTPRGHPSGMVGATSSGWSLVGVSEHPHFRRALSSGFAVGALLGLAVGFSALRWQRRAPSHASSFADPPSVPSSSSRLAPSFRVSAPVPEAAAPATPSVPSSTPSLLQASSASPAHHEAPREEKPLARASDPTPSARAQKSTKPGAAAPATPSSEAILPSSGLDEPLPTAKARPKSAAAKPGRTELLFPIEKGR